MQLEKSLAAKIMSKKEKKEAGEQKKVLDEKRAEQDRRKKAELEEDRRLIGQISDWDHRKRQEEAEKKLQQRKELQEVLTEQINQRGSPARPKSYISSPDIAKKAPAPAHPKPASKPVPAKKPEAPKSKSQTKATKPAAPVKK